MPRAGVGLACGSTGRLLLWHKKTNRPTIHPFNGLPLVAVLCGAVRAHGCGCVGVGVFLCTLMSLLQY